MSDRGDAWAGLRDYRARDAHRVVGLMTGTSADAVDATLVRFTGHGLDAAHRVEAYREEALPPELRREILDLAAAESIAPERMMRLDVALGEHYARSVMALLDGAGRAPADVDAVGMHGQTIRHVPRSHGEPASSLQIGSAAVVAERTGITVVSNFRARDTAAGGEGAPLVPIADWWLFRSAEESRVLLNLGGMANATFLPKGGGLEDVLGFDTGPGNVLLDALMGLRTSPASFDDEGRAAARGQVSEVLLERCLADPFFDLPPPRSTGRERFGRRYAESLLEQGRTLRLSEDDVLATAVALTAQSIADAVRRFLAPRGVDVVVVSGGGVRNQTLMAALAARLAPVRIVTLESLGASSAGKEALAFAFLAHLTLGGHVGNVPGATGAARAVTLGQVTPGWPRSSGEAS